MRKRILSVLLALAMLLTLLPAGALAAEETPEETPEEAGPPEVEEQTAGDPASEDELGEDYIEAEFITSGPGAAGFFGLREPTENTYPDDGKYFGNQLNAASKAVYDALVTNYIKNGAPDAGAGNTVSFASTSTQDLLDGMAAFDRDYSDVFWLGSSRSNDTTVTFSVGGAWETGGRSIAGDISTVSSKVTELANGARAAGADNRYIQLKYVHDWLVNNNRYGDAGGSTLHWQWEAVSALDPAISPVCEGYSRAFKLICDELRIPCVLVSGKGNGGDHMWNYVRMEDGRWYLVDVTWDDPTSEAGIDTLRYDYFLVGSNNQGAHEPNTGFISSGGTYNSTFAYPELSETAYTEPNGPAKIEIAASPEGTKEISYGGNDGNTITAKAYEVPVIATFDESDLTASTSFTLTAAVKDASDISLEGRIVTWNLPKYGNASGPTTDINDYISLVDNKNNTATVTIQNGYYKNHAPAGPGSAISIIEVTAAYGATLEQPFTIHITRDPSKSTFVGKITGLGSVQADKTAKFSAKVYDQYGEEMTGTAPSWSIDPAVNGCSITTDGTLTVDASAATGATINVKATVGDGAGAKTATKEVTVTDAPALNVTVSPASASIVYGNTQKLTPSYTASDGTTPSGVAYTYTSAGADIAAVDANGTVTAKKVGTTTIAVTATKEGYKDGTATVTVTVTPKALALAIVPNIPAVTYTGDGQTPAVTVKDGSKALAENTDYTVAVDPANPIDAKTYKVTITGKGNYSGTVEKAFVINKAAVTSVTTTVPPVEINASSTNNAADKIKDAITLPATADVTYGDSKTATLTVNWTGPKETFTPKGGTYTFTGTVQGDTNLSCDKTITATVTVTPVKLTSLTLSAQSSTAKANTVENTWTPASVTPAITLDATYDTTLSSEPPLTISGWTASPSIADAKKTVTSTNSPKVTFTPTITGIPEWATQDFTMPTYTLTLTDRDPATVTIPEIAARDYDGTAAADPAITAADAGGTALSGDKLTVSYYEKGSATALTGAPKDAGEYTVKAVYSDEMYYGSAEKDFVIRQKEVTLTWSGDTGLTYDGAAKNVTAAAGGLVNGETKVTVQVTGGDKINAGTYTAAATALAGDESANYTLPATGLTKEYTIAKATRTLTVTPAAATPLILTPKAADGTVTATVGENGDKDGTFAAALKFELTGDTTAVTWNKTGGKVTGTGNGVVTIAVSVAETDNYEAVAPQTVTVKSVMRPVLGITGVTGATGDQLSASLDGKTIKVTGIGDKAQVKIALELAGVTGITLTQDPLGTAVVTDKITVKSGETVYDEYTVDLSGVVEKVAGVDVTTGDPATENSIEDAAARSEVDTALSDKTNNTVTGAVEAAGQKLQEEAQKHQTGTITDVEVQVSLSITAKSLESAGGKTSYTVEVKPQYTIVDKNAAPGAEPLVPATPLPNNWLTTEVTVTVKLPATLAGALTGSAQLFAKHKLSGGGYEYLKTTVTNSGADKIASWKMKSFSEVELYTSSKTVTITFQDGDTTSTMTFDESNRNDPLPANSKGTNMWTIGGQDYSKVSELLDGSVTSGTAEPKAGTVTPPSRPSGGSSGSGGSGAGRYTVSKASNMKHGSLSFSTTSARKGDTVTITPKPDKGYEVDTITVLDKNGGRVRVREEDGKYTFTMPDGKVTVEATFRPIEEETEPETGFRDVDSNAYYADAVAWAVEEGITNGNTATTFAPGNPCTRAQIVTFLWRAAGSPASYGANPFTDVEPGAYYYDAVLWAVEKGITGGTTATTFSPGRACTRAQTVTFLYRYEGSPATTTPNPFTDVAEGVYYTNAVLWAVENGITGGTTAATFSPDSVCTRGQIVTFLYRDMA